MSWLQVYKLLITCLSQVSLLEHVWERKEWHSSHFLVASFQVNDKV